MSRVMISAAAYLLSFLFQSSLLWVFLPGATLWSKGGVGGGGHRLTAGLRSPQPLRYSSVAAAAKIVQNGNRIQRCQGHRI